jgi:cell division septum initiation protein DivIVA
MKVPSALLDRLADLEKKLAELTEKLAEFAIMRGECCRAIELIEAAPDEVAPAAAAAGPRLRRTRAAVLAAIEDAVNAADEGGTTLEQIAKRTGMKRSRLDPHIARLVEAEKCVVEGDQIMLNRNPRNSLFSEAAK